MPCNPGLAAGDLSLEVVCNVTSSKVSLFCLSAFHHLGQLIRIYGHIPFAPGPVPPPLQPGEHFWQQLFQHQYQVQAHVCSSFHWSCDCHMILYSYSPKPPASYTCSNNKNRDRISPPRPRQPLILGPCHVIRPHLISNRFHPLIIHLPQNTLPSGLSEVRCM